MDKRARYFIEQIQLLSGIEINVNVDYKWINPHDWDPYAEDKPYILRANAVYLVEKKEGKRDKNEYLWEFTGGKMKLLLFFKALYEWGLENGWTKIRNYEPE